MSLVGLDPLKFLAMNPDDLGFMIYRRLHECLIELKNLEQNNLAVRIAEQLAKVIPH